MKNHKSASLIGLYTGMLCCLMTSQANADATFGTVTPNVNDTYIHSQSYLQNPFVGQISSGGTQYVTESQMEQQNLMERLFADGTWNAQGFAGMVQNKGGPTNTSLAGTLFGQTGQIGGFSLGGAFNITNPWVLSDLNPPISSSQAVASLTAAQQFTPTEAFLEYQYSHILQADLGWIGINNSPFLAENFYGNQSSAYNYQGFSVNVNPLNGWLITALGFNAVQYAGQNGFTASTFYNAGVNYGIPTPYNFSQNSNGTGAIGTSYYTPDNNYNFKIWAYNFKDYANLVYADNTLKLPVNDKTYFTIAAQGGFERGNNMTAAGSNANLGEINSNFIGAQASFNYDWFGLSGGYNNVWGPANAFGQGGLVSPYTFNENVDPLYTNSWMTGLVQKGSAGQAFIVSPSLNFLDKNLTFSPSYSISLPSNALTDEEYDFIASYTVPQIKGLKFFGVYGYQTQPVVGTNSAGQVVQGGANWTTWFVTSYLY